AMAPGMIPRPDGTRYGGERAFVRVWELSYPVPMYVPAAPVRTLEFRRDGSQLAVNNEIVSLARDAVRLPLRPEDKVVGSQALFRENGQLWAVDFPSSTAEDRGFRLVPRAPQPRDVLLKPPPTSDLKASPRWPENATPLYRY